MNYRDLKPGDIMIYGRYSWLVISMRKLDKLCITINFVECHERATIVECQYHFDAEVLYSEVIRSELQRSEAG